ncbi:MAG TPA: DUF1385 domain-containing protein [Candidatus Blautia gallistercoris]|uniref:DUF1385 domain-containing protein n=1 Tax=Candidatus Blautia gallistercoris TaxID=2838490 RepID=A0A9D2B433_9FIRM|nr:DUF1385 domain-containing protein [Candidatus Blautia gallistercoris]
MRSSNIGGQAVMEGIMMRHKDKYSIAVRKPNQEIEIKVEDYRSVLGRFRIMKLPILRGVASFVDSLVVGIQCLMYSASFFEEEEDAEEVQSEEEKAEQARREERMNKIIMYGTVAFSIVLSVGLFMLLPYLLASLFSRLGASEAVITVIEAFVKIFLFLGYMFLISRMEDIQRVFMYHGAEHKCINCVEHGLDLTVENVLKSSRQHKRCGTSFLLLVMCVSIAAHFLFVAVPVMWVRVVARILMVPVVAGVSYELIQWAGRSDNPIACALSKPGLALQKLSTREPDESMAEVAIAAVEAVFDWKSYVEEVRKEEGWDTEPEEAGEAAS